MTTKTSHDIADTIQSLLNRGHIVLPDGRTKTITGPVTFYQAGRIADVLKERNCHTTLETGVALGVSTLAICLAMEDGVHYGVDPCQWTEHEGSALALLKEYQASSEFRLLEGCSHDEMPKLLQKGVTLDFAFIDGWHTFDYTLLDFFYIDKMLKPGGVVAFHDCTWPSKRMVINYILTHRKYRLLPFRRAPYFSWARKFLTDFHEPDSFAGRIARKVNLWLAKKEDLLMLEKVSQWEPNFNYFVPFS